MSSGGFDHLCDEHGCHQEMIIHLAGKEESLLTCSQVTAPSPRKYVTGISDRGFGRLSILCILVSKSLSSGFAFMIWWGIWYVMYGNSEISLL